MKDMKSGELRGVAVDVAHAFAARRGIELVIANVNDTPRAEGALELDRELQEMYGGIYFPVPAPLEPFIVPKGEEELRLELHCDWIDTRTAKHWAAKEAIAG